jgi:hypothetical protein
MTILPAGIYLMRASRETIGLSDKALLHCATLGVDFQSPQRLLTGKHVFIFVHLQ